MESLKTEKESKSTHTNTHFYKRPHPVLSIYSRLHILVLFPYRLFHRTSEVFWDWFGLLCAFSNSVFCVCLSVHRWRCGKSLLTVWWRTSQCRGRSSRVTVAEWASSSGTRRPTTSSSVRATTTRWHEHTHWHTHTQPLWKVSRLPCMPESSLRWQQINRGGAGTYTVN